MNNRTNARTRVEFQEKELTETADKKGAMRTTIFYLVKIAKIQNHLFSKLNKSNPEVQAQEKRKYKYINVEQKKINNQNICLVINTSLMIGEMLWILNDVKNIFIQNILKGNQPDKIQSSNQNQDIYRLSTAIKYQIVHFIQLAQARSYTNNAKIPQPMNSMSQTEYMKKNKVTQIKQFILNGKIIEKQTHQHSLNPQNQSTQQSHLTQSNILNYNNSSVDIDEISISIPNDPSSHNSQAE